MPESVIKQVREFFEMSAKDFVAEWKELSEKDKEDIRKGVENGSLTY